MPASPEELLAAAEALLDDEFNSGISEPVEEVELAGAREDTPELKIDDQGRAHGPDGKFVSVVETEDSAEEEVPADAGIEAEAEDLTEEPPPAAAGDVEDIGDLVFEVDDPELLEYLDKYDGDVIKALQAAREAQSLIGRQGSELGDVRRELAELRSLLSQPQQPQYVYTGPYQNDIDENPEALVYEALERGDAQTMQQAIEAWGEVEPFKAATFIYSLPQMMESLQEAPVEQQAAPQSSLESEFAALKQRHPDVDKHLPGIEKVLQERPHLAAAVASGDSRARTQAFEDALLLARSQAGPDTSAARKIILRAKAEADQAKSDAAVVSASRTSAVEPKGSPNDKLQDALRAVLGDDSFVIE